MAHELRRLRTNSSTDIVCLKTKNANLQGKIKIAGRAEDCAPPKDTPTKDIEPNVTKEEDTNPSNRPQPEMVTTPPEMVTTPPETPTKAEGTSNATKTTAYGVLVQACWTQHMCQYPDELIHKEIEEFNKQCSVCWYNLS